VAVHAACPTSIDAALHRRSVTSKKCWFLMTCAAKEQQSRGCRARMLPVVDFEACQAHAHAPA
jgi:hypothetical protein